MVEMIIEVLIGIILFFVVVIVDHFFVSLGFFSLWAFLMVYLYQKIHKSTVWVFLLLIGIVLGVSMGLGLGTYLLSAGISLFLLFILKSMTPEEYLLIKYIQYLLTFFSFYFGELSINGFLESLKWNDVIGWFVLALISTLLCFLLDRIYMQVREGSSSSAGVGIEIRRRIV